MQCNCGTETIESYAGGTSFQYCRACKVEVRPHTDFEANIVPNFEPVPEPKGLATWIPPAGTTAIDYGTNRSLQSIFIDPRATVNHEVGQQFEIASVNRSTGEIVLRYIYEGKRSP